MNVLIRIILVAALSFGLANIIPGVSIDSFWTAILVAVVLGLLNFFVRPFLVILTLPVTIITLGLFLLVINTLIILLGSKFVSGFHVNGFWPAFWFSLALSIISSFIFSAFYSPED